MSIIKVEVCGRDLSFIDMPTVSAGSAEIDYIEFKFDDTTWNGFGITCVFFKSKTELYSSILNTYSRAKIPKAVLESEGTLYFGLCGTKNDTRLTSTILTYKINDGVYYTGESEVEDLEQSVYEEILTNYSTTITELQDLRSDVDELQNTGAGKIVAGQTIPISQTETTVALNGAEIFNTYVTPNYQEDGTLYSGNVAIGSCSHSEGYRTYVSGNYSHGEGWKTKCTGAYSHTEGSQNVNNGECCHAEGIVNQVSGYASHIEGANNIIDGNRIHVEGSNNQAAGYCAHVEGYLNIANGSYAHAEGSGNEVTSDTMCAHTEGYSNIAKASYSHASGCHTEASGVYAYSDGYHTIASGQCSHASGYYNTAHNVQFVVGKYSETSTFGNGGASYAGTGGSLFIVGNGTADDARSNAFRVSTAGACYGLSAFNSSGADYAEFFEWVDGNPFNEDRRGLFVTLDGEKIRLANSSDDYILGVISASPTVIGDAHSECWKDMYLCDVFGEKLTETVTVPDIIDEQTGEIVFPEHTEERWIINPAYDSSKSYVSREERPEWAYVGFMGKLVVVDDGTCEVNGYCTVANNGIVTASKSGYRVMSRIDDTHIKILLK